MRVSALSAQFVHETPEDPQGDSRRVLLRSEERRKTVGAASAENQASDALSEETKAGLRRLSALIREKNKDDSSKGRKERPRAAAAVETEAPVILAGGAAPEQSCLVYISRRARALRDYLYARNAAGGEETTGQVLDLAV